MRIHRWEITARRIAGPGPVNFIAFVDAPTAEDALTIWRIRYQHAAVENPPDAPFDMQCVTRPLVTTLPIG